jgi:phosphoribosylformylglycinamidine synthase subunit PurL
VFWTFHEAIRGLSDACRYFGVPVISGNVSFYNESFGSPIYPTPTVGLVGLLDDVEKHATVAFKDDGDVVVLVGESLAELGGSEYLKLEHDLVSGRPPALDLELERDVQAAVRDAIRAGLVQSAHDCSEGGLAVALAESCLAGDVGADIHLDDDLHPVPSLFGETQSRIVITVAEKNADALIALLIAHDVPYAVLGTVGGERLTIEDKVDISIDDMRDAFEPTLAMLVAGTVTSDELHQG